jgi:hypothetical protein
MYCINLTQLPGSQSVCQPVYQLAVTSRSPVAPKGPTRVPEGRGTHRRASRGAVRGTHRWRRRRRNCVIAVVLHWIPRGSGVRAEVPPVMDPEAP